MLVVMVRIPVGSAAEGARLEERFRNRQGLVDREPGFLGFELLKGDSEYVSVTRWATREDLDRWMKSQAHAQAHGRPASPTGGGHPHGARHGETPHDTTGDMRPGGSAVTYEVVIPAEAGA